MKKETLEIFAAFTISCRRAVDRLHEERYSGRTYPTHTMDFRPVLDKVRDESLPRTLREKDAAFYDVAHNLFEGLCEQVMLSHQMLRMMYEDVHSAQYFHCHVLNESVERAEALLKIALDLGMRGALGEPPGHLRA